MDKPIKFDKSLINRIKHRLDKKRTLESICIELKINKDDVLTWLHRKDILSPKKQQLLIDYKLI